MIFRSRRSYIKRKSYINQQIALAEPQVQPRVIAAKLRDLFNQNSGAHHLSDKLVITTVHALIQVWVSELRRSNPACPAMKTKQGNELIQVFFFSEIFILWEIPIYRTNFLSLVWNYFQLCFLSPQDFVLCPDLG